jgi:alpha-amylase
LFDIGNSTDYFDDKKNREIMLKVARKCYLPMNALLLRLIERHGENFKISFSISGTAMEQFEEYAPDVLASFKKLIATGNVELLSETYYHSLSFLYNKEEFNAQVAQHLQKTQDLFGVTPQVFRNTELIYNNELAAHVASLGYKAIIAEGADFILGKRSPNLVYHPAGADIKLLLKNYKLSDDIAFRFSNKGWKEWPLTAEKFAEWVDPVMGDSINLFMDYETFGEHQWEDTGIFEFMDEMVGNLVSKGVRFITPTTLADADAKDEIDVHNPISWADVERDLSAWLGNKMQHDAMEKIYHLRSQVFASGDPKLVDSWKKLTTSDHFYYMCVKWFSDGDVHKYFNPYDSPYDGFIAFMNVINDLTMRIEKDHSSEWQKIGGTKNEFRAK